MGKRIATFLGRKLSTQFEGEMGNRFNIRIEGTRIKHTMGPVSIKLRNARTVYDSSASFSESRPRSTI
ncbi:MAG: hypothetical protein ACR2NN_17805 [Bryobacteraceae bacterium]